MAIVRWTRHAANDLQSVYRRLALDSAANAEKMLRRIEEKADELARYPGMGRPGRVPGTRDSLFTTTISSCIARLLRLCKFCASNTLPSAGHKVLRRGPSGHNTSTYPQLSCCVKPFCTLYLPASVWIRHF